MSNLDRFRKAQRTDFETALREIESGRKRSHWMWYIFPQIDGLGFSSPARFYAVSNLDEAVDFLKDEYLGGNLLQISNGLLQLDGNDAGEIMGYSDNLKLRSSMTLFAEAAKQLETADARFDVFDEVLKKYYDGEPDMRTLELL